MPDDWADKILNELENERNEKAQSSRFFAQKTENEIKTIDEKLEKLMNAYLESALNFAEYREAKNKLVNQKQLLKDKLTAFEQKSNDRFELAAKFINSVKQAEIIALQENPFKILAEAEPRLWRGEATIAQNSNSERLRRERDSNSRSPIKATTLFESVPLNHSGIPPLLYRIESVPLNHSGTPPSFIIELSISV